MLYFIVIIECFIIIALLITIAQRNQNRDNENVFKSACTHDCNQGRTCSCQSQKDIKEKFEKECG